MMDVVPESAMEARVVGMQRDLRSLWLAKRGGVWSSALRIYNHLLPGISIP